MIVVHPKMLRGTDHSRDRQRQHGDRRLRKRKVTHLCSSVSSSSFSTNTSETLSRKLVSTCFAMSLACLCAT